MLVYLIELNILVKRTLGLCHNDNTDRVSIVTTLFMLLFLNLKPAIFCQIHVLYKTYFMKFLLFSRYLISCFITFYMWREDHMPLFKSTSSCTQEKTWSLVMWHLLCINSDTSLIYTPYPLCLFSRSNYRLLLLSRFHPTNFLFCLFAFPKNWRDNMLKH